jgi:hypothetical protein
MKLLQEETTQSGTVTVAVKKVRKIMQVKAVSVNLALVI